MMKKILFNLSVVGSLILTLNPIAHGNECLSKIKPNIYDADHSRTFCIQHNLITEKAIKSIPASPYLRLC